MKGEHAEVAVGEMDPWAGGGWRCVGVRESRSDTREAEPDVALDFRGKRGRPDSEAALTDVLQLKTHILPGLYMLAARAAATKGAIKLLHRTIAACRPAPLARPVSMATETLFGACVAACTHRQNEGTHWGNRSKRSDGHSLEDTTCAVATEAPTLVVCV